MWPCSRLPRPDGSGIVARRQAMVAYLQADPARRSAEQAPDEAGAAGLQAASARWTGESPLLAAGMAQDSGVVAARMGAASLGTVRTATADGGARPKAGAVCTEGGTVGAQGGTVPPAAPYARPSGRESPPRSGAVPLSELQSGPEGRTLRIPAWQPPPAGRTVSPSETLPPLGGEGVPC